MDILSFCYFISNTINTMNTKSYSMTKMERRAYRQADLMVLSKEQLVDFILYLEKE